jgi:RNA polymerase sigma factor (sigma-70 family)
MFRKSVAPNDALTVKEEILRYLSRQMRGHEDAADLAQEIYLSYLRRASFVRNPRHYLFKVAGRVLREWKRRHLSSAVTYDSELAAHHANIRPDSAPSSDEVLIEQERLFEVLERIPHQCRKVALMWHRDNLSVEEIAIALKITPGSVRTYLVRATAHARFALADDGREGG